MDAPTHRFGKDTGEIERMLMEYLQQRKTQFRIPFRIFHLHNKRQPFSCTYIHDAKSLPEITGLLDKVESDS
jgi:hypothetical protein